MKKHILICLPAALCCLFAGCLFDDDDPGDNDDDSGDDDATDENNFLSEAPVAVVVTTSEMLEAWQPFAQWKNRTGFRTDVVDVDEVLEGRGDNPTYLRSYIQREYENGLRYVILGGDADRIPYMRSYTEVSNWAMDLNGIAPVQTYFEELDADWDKDGDGYYGEDGDDITVEDLRRPKVAVGRAPVETPEEVEGFIAKVIRYESGQGRIAQRATAPLFLADLADTVPIVGDIDSGIAHEQLIADYIPESFQANMRRLYGTQEYAEEVGAEMGTTENIFQAMEDEGYALVIANTHGNFRYLTQQLSSYVLPTLANETLFVFVTTSCLSGNFADESYGEGLNDPQEGEDSVAEELVKNPDGGAVSYVGNTLIGLGPAGGAQFNHAFSRALFLEGAYILGDAVLEARRTLYAEDIHGTYLGINFSLTTEMFPGSEWYTLRSVIVLGDPTLRIWTAEPGRIELTGPDTVSPGSSLTYLVEIEGESASGVTVTWLENKDGGDFMTLVESDEDGNAEFPPSSSCEAVVTAYKYGYQPASLDVHCEGL